MNTSYSKILIPSVLIVIAGLFGSGLIPDSSSESQDSTITKHSSSQKMLRHVVFFSFNEDASADIIDDIGRTLIALEGSIEVIQSLEWGESVAKGQEYSHCLLVNFDSEEDLATYDVHPDHQKFIDDFGSYFKKVAVVDYWTTE